MNYFVTLNKRNFISYLYYRVHVLWTIDYGVSIWLSFKLDAGAGSEN